MNRKVTMVLRCLAGLGLVMAGCAWAGRPLATDDAATAEQGTCQIEAWHASAWQGEHTTVLAPACGIAPGMELGLEYAQPYPQDPVRAGGGLAFKWAPQAWQMPTAGGPLNFGIKLSTAFEQPAGARWQRVGDTALVLASLQPSDASALHANLGLVRQQPDGLTATLLNLAAVWTPEAHWLLFAEAQTNDRQEVLGTTVYTAGVRRWLVSEKLGLDLTNSQTSGSSSAWTLGLGWYGLSF